MTCWDQAGSWLRNFDLAAWLDPDRMAGRHFLWKLGPMSKAEAKCGAGGSGVSQGPPLGACGSREDVSPLLIKAELECGAGSSR